MSYETDYSTLFCVHFYSIAPNSRAAINHSSGRWVYFSERYDWGKKKKGHSNHYSFTYNRHGSKAKVGGDVRTAGARLKQWAYATAYGKSSDTFSCWYRGHWNN